MKLVFAAENIPGKAALRLVVSIMMLLSIVQPAFAETITIPDPTPTLEAPSIIPIVFPVVGKCTFTSTFGDPRDGGKRKHEGNDLMAPKMTPVVAAADGTIAWLQDGSQTSTANGLPYYNLLLKGDDGNDYFYVHLNNDTPGTDDGEGGPENAYAPGIINGSRVMAGQHIGYVGDSGNAENTSPHLHFEIHYGGYKNPIDPYRSLKVALGENLFKDVSLDDWSFQYINNLVKKGVLNGYANGRFKPEGLVSRAEFIKMVVVATELETATAYSGAFLDVKESHWSWSYLEAAKRAGIIEGDVNGKCRPDKPINRAEAAKIISKVRRAAEVVQGEPFLDVSQDFWAHDAIMAARGSGTISGYPNGTFKPLNPTNRAEASKIIYMVCKQ